MMRNHTMTTRLGPSAKADAARVVVRASYLLGRRGQAPITRAREADT
jgi:hypothetical protein